MQLWTMDYAEHILYCSTKEEKSRTSLVAFSVNFGGNFP